jgi:hypothetical protein
MIYFILIYVFSNLAAFGVVLLTGAVTGKEQISDFKAFYTTNPLLSWILTIALFSLAGVPPTAGFFGKFFLLMAGAAKGNYWLIAIAAINMVVSFYFDELDGVKCAIVEKNVLPQRVQFLKELLSLNQYEVIVQASPPPKQAAPAPAATEEPVPAAPAAPETFTVGVTNVMFNATNAIFGRLLKTADGHVVTLAYWKQEDKISHDEIPYYESKKPV